MKSISLCIVLALLIVLTVCQIVTSDFLDASTENDVQYQRRLHGEKLKLQPGYILLIILVVFVGPSCLWISHMCCKILWESTQGNVSSLLRRKVYVEKGVNTKETAESIARAF
jgi:hypothetical protein